MLIIVVAGMILAPIVAMVYFVYEGIIKPYRCHKWYKEHDGIKIGSDEFFDWCYKNQVNVSYFL